LFNRHNNYVLVPPSEQASSTPSVAFRGTSEVVSCSWRTPPVPFRKELQYMWIGVSTKSMLVIGTFKGLPHHCRPIDISLHCMSRHHQWSSPWRYQERSGQPWQLNISNQVWHLAVGPPSHKGPCQMKLYSVVIFSNSQQAFSVDLLIAGSRVDHSCATSESSDRAPTWFSDLLSDNSKLYPAWNIVRCFPCFRSG